MSSNKAALKAAKAALDAGNFDETVTQAQSVIAADSNNYNARLLLGRALEKKGVLEDAEATYRAATKSKPDDSQAWSGLCSVFGAQGSKNVDAYVDATMHLAQIHASADDEERCQTVVDRLQGFVKQHGKPAQVRRALGIMLPTSPVYEALEGRVQRPSLTYLRIAESLEAEEAQRLEREIATRRTRIGAKLGQVTVDVKREVFGLGELEEAYKNVIDWATDDEIRHQYEEKLLQRAYDTLVVSPLEQKAGKLDQVLTLAEGMVIIRHPFQLAWDLVLESRDLDNLQELDVNILREYIEFFPKSGLASVLEAWLGSELSPFPPPPKGEEPDSDKPAEVMKPEDRLLMLTDGLAKGENSPLAHRLSCDYYLHLEEYESTTYTARTGLDMLSREASKLGMSLQNTKDALNSVLGTALVHFEAPRNHAEAKRLFENILQRKPRSTSALIGLGLIFEEMENFQEAVNFLQQALGEDLGNLRVGVELAWCKALAGDHAQAQKELESYLPQVKGQDPRTRDLRAQCLYRIGVCMWNNDPSKAARKDRNGAYGHFLSAIKTNVDFAPAYTSLGYYYEQYAKDRKRARQCFQKAFELSSAETDAAERLARSFAAQGEWEIVEIIAQRIIDSGRARPPPGSKRKGLSWPYSALGVVQMNKQEYQQAIVSFLAALRISPDDYQSYVGLGESYHNSGRYNSASRTFSYALEPHDKAQMNIAGETWFARYMLANVHRELGEYEEAIDGLRAVLEERSSEFGVLMSLLQTFIEKAWRCVNTGLYGQAVDSAKQAISTAVRISKDRPHAFNMWKAVGDACMVFSSIQSSAPQLPTGKIRALMHVDAQRSTFEVLSDIDQITLEHLPQTNGDEQSMEDATLSLPITAGILAFKRALHSCSADPHARAVAWYNLGWAEHRAHTCCDAEEGKVYLKAAVRCFKRAIELEAGNAEFWNALGVVTTTLNPKVAQHSLVRSLHLSELNAKVWTNLGVLYLTQNDFELAHKALSRAQSTDPEYAHAWIGEGLISLLTGESREALNHFTHAFEISDASSMVAKKQYAMSSFDNLMATPTASNDLRALIQPLFALEQLRAQAPRDLPFRHLAALFLERVGDFAEGIDTLSELCTAAEADYEATESLRALSHFARAKADLARCQLAALEYAQAAENAETALDLSSDAGNSGLDPDARRKLRLSAHLTAGLAHNSLHKSPEAIDMFRSALQESEGNPDVVCLLVKMLWAHGGADEKAAARDQLFECVEKHPQHAASVTLLGAIAALDGDADTVAAVTADLLALRTHDRLPSLERDGIEALLSSLAALADDADGSGTALNQAQSAVLLEPDHSRAWTELARLSGEAYPARMALVTAQKSVPPHGDVGAEDLAAAFVGHGTVRDAQRATALAPWMPAGLGALRDTLGAGA